MPSQRINYTESGLYNDLLALEDVHTQSRFRSNRPTELHCQY